MTELELFKSRLKTSEECRDNLAFALNNLRARFSDLAIELEKHSNDHIRSIDISESLIAAVEGVCADRIKAILK